MPLPLPPPRDEPEFVDIEFLLIDVSHLAHRHAFALERFETRDGRKSGHVYGSFKNVKALAMGFRPKNLVFVYDRGASWRKALLPTYKANRRAGGAADITVPLPDGQYDVYEGQPSDWTPAPDVERLLRSFPGIHLACDDMEADDMAAWFVQNHSVDKREGAIVLYTGDRDYWQLVSNDNNIAAMMTKKTKGGPKKTTNVWIWDEHVEESFGVPPSALAKLKAFLGDDSDNIRGLEGASRPGKKKALRDFAKSAASDVYFDLSQPCPALTAPDWLAPELVAQRERLAMNLSIIDLVAATKRLGANGPAFNIIEGSTMEAMGVLAEFECESAMSMVEPLFREMTRAKRLPRPFG